MVGTARNSSMSGRGTRKGRISLAANRRHLFTAISVLIWLMQQRSIGKIRKSLSRESIGPVRVLKERWLPGFDKGSSVDYMLRIWILSFIKPVTFDRRQTRSATLSIHPQTTPLTGPRHATISVMFLQPISRNTSLWRNFTYAKIYCVSCAITLGPISG